MNCRIQSIDRERFKKFGYVLEFPENEEKPFYIVAEEEREPWRLAVFRYSSKSVNVLECHPASMESFEPLKGLTVLIVAEHDRPSQHEAFVLDKPVCLYKGIWHQVLSLTDEAQVKIAENLEVTSEFYDLECEVSVGLVANDYKKRQIAQK